MSWIRECTLNWFQFLALRIIRTGRIPRHVAFIMDGNRRYASKQNIEKGEGHSRGYVSLNKVCRYILVSIVFISYLMFYL